MAAIWNVLSYILFFIFFTLGGTQDLDMSWRFPVKDLSAEPDFRAIQLRWRYPYFPDPPAFTVHLCEVTWSSGKQRCRERYLSTTPGTTQRNTHDVLRKVNRGSYEAVINDLRMLTNYSVAVQPHFPRTVSSPYSQLQIDRNRLAGADFILVTTKGFTARAARCLANTSDIIVNTGPYFSGKISAESIEDDRCAVYGNKNSEQDTYTLTILHDLCGTKVVNNSRTESVVIVHENKEIVTHNSRRFLVVCHFMPESFTIRASVSVPLTKKEKAEVPEVELVPIGQSVKEDSSNDIFTYDHYRDSNVRDSRILAEQKAALDRPILQQQPQVIGHLVLMVILVVVAVVACVVAIWWFVIGSRRRAGTAIRSTTVSSPDSYVAFSADKDVLVKKDPPTDSKQPANVYPVFGTSVALVAIRPIRES